MARQKGDIWNNLYPSVWVWEVSRIQGDTTEGRHLATPPSKRAAGQVSKKEVEKVSNRSGKGQVEASLRNITTGHPPAPIQEPSFGHQ